MSIFEDLKGKHEEATARLASIAEQIIMRLDSIEEGVTRETVEDTWFTRPFSGNRTGAGVITIEILKPPGVAWVIQHLAAVLPANGTVELYGGDAGNPATYLYELTGGNVPTDHPAESGLKIYVPSQMDRIVAVTTVGADATVSLIVQGTEMVEGR